MSVKFDPYEGFEQPDTPLFIDAVQYELIPPGGFVYEFPVERVEPPVDDEAA